MEHIQEHDDVAAFKAWWKENGTPIVVGLVVGFAGIIGWQWWGAHQQTQGEAASQLFQQMQVALEKEDTETVLLYGEQLRKEYPDTIYAESGTLALAAAQVKQKDFAAARSALQWVEQQGRPEYSELARLNLARLDLQEEKPEAALARISVGEAKQYVSWFTEVRGDALAMQGKQAEAYQAYTDALKLLSRYDEQLALLKMKLVEVAP